MKVMGHKCAASKIAPFIQLIIPSSEHGNLLGLSEERVVGPRGFEPRTGGLRVRCSTN